MVISGILIAIILLLAASLYFFEYTAPGYRMSIAIHGFEEISDNIYVDQNWTGDTNKLLSLIGEARERVNTFLVRLRITQLSSFVMTSRNWNVWGVITTHSQ